MTEKRHFLSQKVEFTASNVSRDHALKGLFQLREVVRAPSGFRPGSAPSRKVEFPPVWPVKRSWRLICLRKLLSLFPSRPWRPAPSFCRPLPCRPPMARRRFRLPPVPLLAAPARRRRPPAAPVTLARRRRPPAAPVILARPRRPNAAPATPAPPSRTEFGIKRDGTAGGAAAPGRSPSLRPGLVVFRVVFRRVFWIGPASAVVL